MRLRDWLLDLLEKRPEWVAAAAGVLTALAVYLVIRQILLFVITPGKPATYYYRLAALFFRLPVTDCSGMDALRNTPQGEVVNGPEKRGSFRRRDNVVEILVAVAPGAEPQFAWVVDRSSSGLGVVLMQAVEVGTVIGVRPMDAPADAAWTDVEVRSCSRQGKHWRIGCRFLETPDWSTLLRFG